MSEKFIFPRNIRPLPEIRILQDFPKLSSLGTPGQLITTMLCVFLISCAKTDSRLDSYFSGLMTGNDQVDFPYTVSSTDVLCVLQAYQNRVRQQSDFPIVSAINSRLGEVSFRGEESSWVLASFSEGRVFLHRVDRYKAPLSSPVDSDYGEWGSEVGKKSMECVTGAHLRFSVFINQTTGERRVGIASYEGE